MALGRGWWVSEATGESREVYRHVSDVVEHPDVFGLTREGVARASASTGLSTSASTGLSTSASTGLSTSASTGLSTSASTGLATGVAVDAASIADGSDASKRLRTAAIMLGWIRVRFHRHDRSVELFRFDERAQRSLGAFLERIGAHDVEVLLVNEFATGRSRPMTVAQIVGRTSEPSCAPSSEAPLPAAVRAGPGRLESDLRRIEERWGATELALFASPTGAESGFWFDAHWPVSPFGLVTLSCVGRAHTSGAVIVPNRLLYNLPRIVAGEPVPHFRAEVERWMPTLRLDEVVYRVPGLVTMLLRACGTDEACSRPTTVVRRSRSFASLAAAHLRAAHAAHHDGDELMRVMYAPPPGSWMEGMARQGWDLSLIEGLCERPPRRRARDDRNGG